MKRLNDFLNEAINNQWITPSDPETAEVFNNISGEEAYKILVVQNGVDVWTKFNWQTVVNYAEDPEGLYDYSGSAKRSVNSAGKKYAKLLEKLLKPKFSGKSNKTIEEIEDEFADTDYFKDDAWEWAPGARTGLLSNYWNYYGFWICLKYYFGEISKDEYTKEIADIGGYDWTTGE